jgi:hypothetical protein
MVNFRVTKKAKEEKLAQLTPEKRRELQDIEDYAILKFEGSFDELEAALGVLRLGPHIGWKVLYTIHSKRTIRKYEDILGIRIREVFPETGPSSHRSVGYQIVQRVSNFWKAVSGEMPIENRRKITK